MNPTDQSAIDRALIDFDGTSSLSSGRTRCTPLLRQGGAEKEVPLPAYCRSGGCRPLPSCPNFHRDSGISSNNLNYQEIQICPIGAKDVTEAVCMGAETLGSRSGGEIWVASCTSHGSGHLAPPMQTLRTPSTPFASTGKGTPTDAVKLAIVVGVRARRSPDRARWR